MRYQPTDLKDRSYIGEHWNKYFLRSFQIILQATHGIVSGAAPFFNRAFGENSEQFRALLTMPQHFIFNRNWYEYMGGKPELEQYEKDFNALSNDEKNQLLDLICKNSPKKIEDTARKLPNKKLSHILNYYTPLSDELSVDIWAKQKKERDKEKLKAHQIVPDDERVEDANLEVA